MLSSKKVPIYDSTTLGHPAIYKLRELIRYRPLLWNLVARDLKVRYKRSIIGFVWVMLNPLITMGVLVVVFATIYHTQITHFATYVLSGLLLWNMFSQGTVAALTSMQANSNTIRKIYVPPSVFVLSAVGSAFINFLFALIPFILLAFVDGLRPHLSWLYVVIPSLQTAMLTAGISLVISAFAVFFADIYELYQVVLNLLFFLTPVMYPLSILSPEMLTFQRFNPMFYIITAFRTAILDGVVPPWELTAISFLLAGGVLAAGWFIFTRAEDRFAYLL